MVCLFLVLPHVAELRKTEAFGQGEMSSATSMETLAMGGLKGNEPLPCFLMWWPLVASPACAEGAGSQCSKRCTSVSGHMIGCSLCPWSSIPHGELLWWTPRSMRAQSKGGHCHCSLRRTLWTRAISCLRTTNG